MTEAALATIDFDTAGCNDSSEDAKAFVDNILAGMPPPGTGRVLLIACYSGGTTQGDEHFARAARAGIDVFFIENSINVTEFNLSFEDHMVLQFLPDNEEGARFTGQVRRGP